MNGYTRVIVVGNVTRDPELRYTPKGTAVCDLSIAVNRKWRNEAGDVQEECSFVDCTAFGKTAETLGQYMKKGAPILLEGRLKQETWEDKQTHQNRSKLKVQVEHFTFLPDGKARDGAAPGTRAPARKPAPGAEVPQESPPTENQEPPDDSEPLPF